MKELYSEIFIDKNPRFMYDAFKMEALFYYYKAHLIAYNYYIEELKVNNLKIIDRYVDLITNYDPVCVGFSISSSFDPVTRMVRKKIKESIGIPVTLGGAVTPSLEINNFADIFERENIDI